MSTAIYAQDAKKFFNINFFLLWYNDEDNDHKYIK